MISLQGAIGIVFVRVVSAIRHVISCLRSFTFVMLMQRLLLNLVVLRYVTYLGSIKDELGELFSRDYLVIVEIKSSQDGLDVFCVGIEAVSSEEPYH